MAEDSLDDAFEPRFPLEIFSGSLERIVQPRDLSAQSSVFESRIVHRPADEAVSDDFPIEIEDSFAEATTGVGGLTIVSDMWGKDSDSSGVGSAFVMIDVVSDGSSVDD